MAAGETAEAAEAKGLAAGSLSGNNRRVDPTNRRCVIGLGANLGDKIATFEAALTALAELGRVEAVSQVYETAPVGGPVQPDYYNAAVCIRSHLAPRSLLQKLLKIEQDHGRIRDCRWGPRQLDLDILWIEATSIDEPGLNVPHSRLLERNFALVPLIEVAPDAEDPNTGMAYRDSPNSCVSVGMRLLGLLGASADLLNGRGPAVTHRKFCR